MNEQGWKGGCLASCHSCYISNKSNGPFFKKKKECYERGGRTVLALDRTKPANNIIVASQGKDGSSTHRLGIAREEHCHRNTVEEVPMNEICLKICASYQTNFSSTRSASGSPPSSHPSKGEGGTLLSNECRDRL